MFSTKWAVRPRRRNNKQAPGLQDLSLQKGGQVGPELTLHRGNIGELPTKHLSHPQRGVGRWWVAGLARVACPHGRGCLGDLVGARLVQTLHTTSALTW